MSERAMADLIALLERRLGVAWTDVIVWLRDNNGIQELERRLATGDIGQIIDGVSEAAEKFAADTHAAFVTAGQTAARALDEQVSDAVIRFDVVNADAVRYAEANRLELVRGLTQEARETVHQLIVDGVRAGRNPLETAKLLRETIGLAPTQADAVASYRRALEAGDYRNALSRALSDGRSDRSLEAALRRGELIGPERVDSMTARYAKNMLAHRAEAIARTESQRAAHGGSNELYRQAIAAGDVDAEALVQSWNHAGHGPNSRPGHVQMNGTRIRFGETFTNPVTGAELRWPCDPQAPASETIQCRCNVSTRLVA